MGEQGKHIDPCVKLVFIQPQAHIPFLFLILFFMCSLLRVLEGKKKKKKKLSHFDPLIIMICLELSRHSIKSFISKLVKHDSFS